MTNEFIPQHKPEWANYLAQDGDGWWFWFEEKPEYDRFGAFARNAWKVHFGKLIRCGISGRPMNPEAMLFHCDQQGNRTLVLKGADNEQ